MTYYLILWLVISNLCTYLLIHPGISGYPDCLCLLISKPSRLVHLGSYHLLKTSRYRSKIAFYVPDDVNSIPAEVSQYYKIKKVLEKG